MEVGLDLGLSKLRPEERQRGTRRQAQAPAPGGGDGTQTGLSWEWWKDPVCTLETDTPGSRQDRLDDSLHVLTLRWGRVRKKGGRKQGWLLGFWKMQEP